MLVISGPPGVGKTTVAWKVFSRCADGGRAPAMADLDVPGAAWPAPYDDPFQHRLKAPANWRLSGPTSARVAAAV